MSDRDAIVVRNMGKKFRLRNSATRTLKSTLLGAIKLRGASRHDFWALKDVDFSVSKGETLGIIGANGAGKSTLLSLLAGTKEPTEGTLHMRGTISSLLELGAGFHPDLTGRENVFLCGAVMGLPQATMKERFDAIVEFADMREFIDQPVKHYSSGMYVRLGFAVAVEVNPDILLIDEALAVGDAAFQRKCVRKMKDFKEKGKTMLIISHDLATIQSVSDRILLLDRGSIVGIGSPDDMLGRYRSISGKKTARGIEKEWGTGEVRILDVRFLNEKNETADTFRWGESLTAEISYEASKRIQEPVFGFAVADENGRVVYGNNTQNEKFTIPEIEGKASINLRIRNLSLAGGNYFFSFSVHSADHRVNYHRLDNRFPITIESEKNFEGCYMPVEWSEKG